MGSKRNQPNTSGGLANKSGKTTIHPIWSGVGVFMFVLVPVLGYLGALLILDMNRTARWFKIPVQLLIPGADNLLLIKVIFTIIIGAIVYFILMLLTFIIYRYYGPKQLGPLDTPPVRWKSKDDGYGKRK